MAESVGVFDGRARFSELIDRAERGEETVVTRHGKPVARVAPLEAQQRSKAEHDQLMAEARALRDGIRARGVVITRDEIQAWKAEGRR